MHQSRPQLPGPAHPLCCGRGGMWVGAWKMYSNGPWPLSRTNQDYGFGVGVVSPPAARNGGKIDVGCVEGVELVRAGERCADHAPAPPHSAPRRPF